MNAPARVRLKIKGRNVYLLPVGEDRGDLVGAGRAAAKREPYAWAVVAFFSPEEGGHGCYTNYYWPNTGAGPLLGMPSSVAAALAEAVARE